MLLHDDSVATCRYLLNAGILVVAVADHSSKTAPNTAGKDGVCGRAFRRALPPGSARADLSIDLTGSLPETVRFQCRNPSTTSCARSAGSKFCPRVESSTTLRPPNVQDARRRGRGGRCRRGGPEEARPSRTTRTCFALRPSRSASRTASPRTVARCARRTRGGMGAGRTVGAVRTARGVRAGEGGRNARARRGSPGFSKQR